MPSPARQHAARSITAGAVRLHRAGGLSAGGKSLADNAAIGLADYPLPGGGWLTKPCGAGTNIFIGERNGDYKSFQLAGGKYRETTALSKRRKSKRLPGPRITDRLLGLDPATINCWLSIHRGIPYDDTLVELGVDGTVTVTLLGGKKTTFAAGMQIPAQEIECSKSNGKWTFSSNHRYIELRCGSFFDRLRYEEDTKLWMRFCQLTRAPLNVDLGGFILRPKNKVLVSASPHPFVIDGSSSFKVLLSDGSRLSRGDEWWVVHQEASGLRHELVFYDGAWRKVVLGVRGYSANPVLSEKQLSANVSGIIDVFRNGSCQIMGCGLVFVDGEEIDITTPELVAYRPAGIGQWLTISDGDSEMVALYSSGVFVGEEQWYVGRPMEFPSSYRSMTPKLIAIAIVVFVYLRLMLGDSDPRTWFWAGCAFVAFIAFVFLFLEFGRGCLIGWEMLTDRIHRCF